MVRSLGYLIRYRITVFSEPSDFGMDSGEECRIYWFIEIIQIFFDGGEIITQVKSLRINAGEYYNVKPALVGKLGLS